MIAKVYLNKICIGVLQGGTMLMQTSTDLESLRDATVELIFDDPKDVHLYQVAGWGPTYETSDARIVERFRVEKVRSEVLDRIFQAAGTTNERIPLGRLIRGIEEMRKLMTQQASNMGVELTGDPEADCFEIQRRLQFERDNPRL